MKTGKMSGPGRFALAASVVIVVAGCAAPAPAEREGTVAVKKVEQRSWDSSPEPGLYRLEFDAARMQQIRREAASVQALEGVGPYTAEIRLLDWEAERELKARGLCNGSARLTSVLTEGDGRSSASGMFKCSPPVF
jgi:hypothetical protein